MCSMYWTFIAEIECPKCKKRAEYEMQTHDFGEAGSCINYYKLGQPVEELAKVKEGKLIELFSEECKSCKNVFVCDVEVKDSKIMKTTARERKSQAKEVL